MLDLISYSFKSVFANKTRSFLTMLGIIVGITSMMIISIIGRAFTDTFNNITSILYKSEKMSVYISPSDENHTYVTDNYGQVILPDSVYIDIRKVRKLFENSKYDNAYISTGSYVDSICKGIYNGRTGNTLIWSTYASETTTATQLMQKGRGISLSDNLNGAATAVISDITERSLFGDGGDALNNTILIQVGSVVIPVVVVGVYTDPNYDIYHASFVYINQSYIENDYSNIINDEYWKRQNFVITLDSIEDKAAFKKNTVNELNKMFDNNQWKITASTESESLESTKTLVYIILKIVFVIACIALFVGGLGIMSIMIITVTERTGEIGIRKSFGASNSMLIIQFLCESMTLSLLGTGCGIILGMITSKLISIKASSYLSDEFKMSIAVNIVLPTEMILVAIISAILIGMVFGFYPAWRASKMEIVDSLRYEV